MTESASI